VHGRTIGALALTMTARSQRSFGPEDETLAGELAARAAMAIENSRLHSALAARERQQAAVSRLGQMALGEVDLQPLFEATVVEVGHVLEADVVNILQLTPSGDAFLLTSGVGWRRGMVGKT